jgi:hypothetical protein
MMRPEYRKNTRRSVRQGARMVSADGATLGKCLMLDVSASGARLKVDTPDALPDEFTLLLSRGGQLRRQCGVAWRSGTAIGVYFHQDTPIKKK